MTSSGQSTEETAHLALLWHHHQPLYRTVGERRLRQPWVRLHALRDYYSMAAIAAEHPGIEVTFNFTPVLLRQLDDYLDREATDPHLELTRTPPEALDGDGREQILTRFFDADWHHQIFAHPRYRELFEKRSRREAFDARDLCDLQMWFNLAWFGKEFRDGPVELVTGETVRVHRFVEQGRGFSASDVEQMVADQFKIMRAIVPLHRKLQDRGRIEVTTSPFYHPILPLLLDTDRATVDLDGARFPEQFSRPEDARMQVERAIDDYEARFGCKPRGMWPAEGAVSPAAARLFDACRIEWIASDRDLLARSGKWGYEVEDPDVLYRPYGVDDVDGDLAIFFRDTPLSDAIGFHYQDVPAEEAASRFIDHLHSRLAGSSKAEDHVVSVVLDGENAWGGYSDDGRPFLHALYDRLVADPDIRSVTFSNYLAENSSSGVSAPEPRRDVYELFTGSWIDEPRSAAGIDLGTWIGEAEENRAWELLGEARRAVEQSSGAGAEDAALDALLAAEGSDWFWWFGEDQDSGDDNFFDDMFRAHLKAAYEKLGLQPPDELDSPLATHHVVWSFARPVDEVSPGDRVVVRTNCPGRLRWWHDDNEATEIALHPVGGVLAGSRRFQALIGDIQPTWNTIHFQFLCIEPDCPRRDTCCRGEVQSVDIHASV